GGPKPPPTCSTSVKELVACAACKSLPCDNAPVCTTCARVSHDCDTYLEPYKDDYGRLDPNAGGGGKSATEECMKVCEKQRTGGCEPPGCNLGCVLYTQTR